MAKVHLAGSVFDPPRHVCAFFHSHEQPERIFIPYMREGLEQGDRVISIVDPQLVATHERQLEAAGLPLPPGTPLEVQGWDESYLKDGYFDVERQLEFMESTLASSREQGYPMTRFVASMEWLLEPRPGVEDVVEYETRLNMLMTKVEDAAVCHYDLARFNAAMIIDILRAHPMILLAGRLHLNPFFVAPQRLLAELRERKSRPASPTVF